MRNVHAFSLLELLACCLIIAIISAIAYPNYQRYILSTQRHQAEISLLQLASQLENYHALHNSYMGWRFPNLPTAAPPTYRFSLQKLAANHYLLQAAPLKTQSKDRCGIIAINEIGVTFARGIREPSCWLD